MYIRLTSPDVVLNQELCTLTSVDSVVVAIEHIVVDVAMAEAEGRSAGVDVGPVVVRVSHRDLGVLGAVGVGVSNERAFPVVVELAVSDGDASDAVCEIEKTVIAKYISKLD